jgi:ABC-type transport system involved in multi-copper enzyme maturation permease subunit
MIAKELRDIRWPLLAGLVVLALLANSAAGTDLHAVTLTALQNQSDSSFSAVSSGHVAPGTAALWATFFSDFELYVLVGLAGALVGARLIASEVAGGTVFLLLSRPLSRLRLLLTKYGVAAAAFLLLAGLCGALALLIGAGQGLPQPPPGGLAASVALLWLAQLFVLGVTLIYSVLLPNALAAGLLGFFTCYAIAIGPLFHIHTPSLPGGTAWSLPTYWSSLDIYAGVANPTQALLISALAALAPLLLALLLFQRRAY